MVDVLRNRLAHCVDLDDEDWDALSELGRNRRRAEVGEELISAGQPVTSMFVLLSGWAIRYRSLDDGRRQIVNFLLPGDLFDLQALAAADADHAVSVVSPSTIATFSPETFKRVMNSSVELTTGFWWAMVQEESFLREQVVRIGRRSALERISHLLLELRRRLSAASGREIEDLPLPVTRTDIADALGLTPIHVSRTMASMKRSKLITEHRGTISLSDQSRLETLARFDPLYFHERRIDLVRRAPAAERRTNPVQKPRFN